MRRQEKNHLNVFYGVASLHLLMGCSSASEALCWLTQEGTFKRFHLCLYIVISTFMSPIRKAMGGVCVMIYIVMLMIITSALLWGLHAATWPLPLWSPVMIGDGGVPPSSLYSVLKKWCLLLLLTSSRNKQSASRRSFVFFQLVSYHFG